MRTVITLKPHAGPEAQPFEFAGYTVVATDTKIQNIAKLETSSEASASADVAPEIGGFSKNTLGAKISRSQKSSAEISQQYENLGIDITPEVMTITRESERGLDVVGNTLVALTLAAPLASVDRRSAFLAGMMKLQDKGKVLDADNATLEIKPLTFLSRCDLKADVTLNYQLRRIVKGREFYTEGKQQVELAQGESPKAEQTLVRADDVQGSMYQLIAQGSRKAVLVSTTLSQRRRLVFDSYLEATEMANWLNAGQRLRVGQEGPLLWIRDGEPLPAGEKFQADFYSVDCAGAPD